MGYRQRKQVYAHELLGSLNVLVCNKLSFEQRNVVAGEVKFGCGYGSRQRIGVRLSAYSVGVTFPSHDPQIPILRSRGGCPKLIVLAKPSLDGPIELPAIRI